MRRRLRAVAVGVAVTVVVSLPSCGDEPDSFSASQVSSPQAHVRPTDEELAAGTPLVRHLAAELYGPLADDAGDANLAFSPLSIATALGMTRAGAEGASAEQLDELFAVGDATDLHRALNATDETLRGLSGPERDSTGQDVRVDLTTANALWGQSGTTWRDRFLDELKGSYDAAMWSADYRNDPDQARGEINRWVSERTNERIDDLLPEGSISTDTRLVLANAVWFQAPWDVTLDELDAEPFTRPDGTTVEAPMVGDAFEMPYASGDGWRAVTLPYAGGDLAMTLLVPDAGELEAVEARLDDDLLAEAVTGGEPAVVDLRFPRFDLDQRAAVGDALRTLGVTAPFELDTTDFAPMTDEERLHLADVEHRATVTVDEHGTEAAAATGAVFETVGGVIGAQELVVDRPFLFIIHDTATGAPVFLGRVTDPTVG